MVTMLRMQERRVEGDVVSERIRNGVFVRLVEEDEENEYLQCERSHRCWHPNISE